MKSSSFAVVTRSPFLLLGMLAFIWNAGSACPGLQSISQGLQFIGQGGGETLTFEGTWTNTTFDTTGSATYEIDLATLTLTFDLDGGVFGAQDPGPVTVPGVGGETSIVFEASDDPFYGDIRVEVGLDDGSITVLFGDVPAAGIDRLEGTGTLDLILGTATVNYTVFFSDGSQAAGVTAADQTSAPLFEVLMFAQVGNGEGLTSDLVFLNPTEETVTGQVSFAGDGGNPLGFGIASSGSVLSTTKASVAQVEDTVEFEVPALGSTTISTDGQGALVAGSALVISDGVLGGVIRFNLPGAGFVTVPDSEPVEAFIIPVRRTDGVINTGIAIRNATNAKTNVMLSLRQGGQEVASKTILNFPANGHLAQFLDQLFPGFDTDGFTGTLVVRGDGVRLAGVALELGPLPGQFGTLPVTPLP